MAVTADSHSEDAYRSSRRRSGDSGRGVSLRSVVAVLATSPLIASLFVSSVLPLIVRFEGALLWGFCFLPSWLYLGQPRHRRRPIPLLSIIGVMYGLYYALPPALGAYNVHGMIQVAPQTDYAWPVEMALIGWLLVLTGYYGYGVLKTESEASGAFQLSAQEMKRWGLLILGIGVVAEVAMAVFHVPLIFAGTLGFVASLQWFGLIILIVLAVRGQLPLPPRLVLITSIIILGAIAFGSSQAAQIARLCIGLVLGAWVAKRQLSTAWVLGIILSGVLVVSVRGISGEFRSRVWQSSKQWTTTEKVGLMAELFRHRIATEGIWSTIDAGGEAVLSRSANMDVFADVVRRTPEEVPFWQGQSYFSLVGAFVPRFLWPDKPVKEIGQSFGHRYGYLHPRDTSTSFNLPVLVEFYANFGAWGVLLGSLLLGATYRMLCDLINNPQQGVLLSAAAVTLFQPLFNIESGVSLSFGGLILDGVALWLIFQAIGHFSSSGRKSSVSLELSDKAV